MLEIIEKWQGTGLVTNVPEELVADMCYVLENQRVHNEEANMSAQFHRISVPLARRVFPYLESHKTRKVESRPDTRDYLEWDTGIVYEPYEAPPGQSHSLDREAEQVATLAWDLKEAIDDFIESHGKDDFDTFYFQCFGLDPDTSNIMLYYDIDPVS